MLWILLKVLSFRSCIFISLALVVTSLLRGALCPMYTHRPYLVILYHSIPQHSIAILLANVQLLKNVNYYRYLQKIVKYSCKTKLQIDIYEKKASLLLNNQQFKLILVQKTRGAFQIQVLKSILISNGIRDNIIKEFVNGRGFAQVNC